MQKNNRWILLVVVLILCIGIAGWVFNNEYLKGAFLVIPFMIMAIILTILKIRTRREVLSGRWKPWENKKT